MSAWMTTAMIAATAAVIVEFVRSPTDGSRAHRFRIVLFVAVVIGCAVWLLIDGAVPTTA